VPSLNGHALSDPTPTADVFYSQVVSHDPAMFAFYKRREGYFLTGETSDRRTWMDWGSGANMKGTTTTIRAAIMGPFAVALSKDVMVMNKAGGSGKGAATPHLMPLVNARIGVLSETVAEDNLDAALLKTWSGDDEASCRPLYGKQFTFKPQAKLETNHKPQWE
jgi:putative DNA primase/helicase